MRSSYYFMHLRQAVAINLLLCSLLALFLIFFNQSAKLDFYYIAVTFFISSIHMLIFTIQRAKIEGLRIQEVFVTEIPTHTVFQLPVPRGLVTLDCRIYPEYDDQHDVVSVISILQDITEQSRFEEQLRQTQKMEAIGQLAGGGSFFIYLPIVSCVEKGDQPEPDIPETLSGPGRILLVDDEEIVAQTIWKMVSWMGYGVANFKNSREGASCFTDQ